MGRTLGLGDSRIEMLFDFGLKRVWEEPGRQKVLDKLRPKIMHF